MSSDRAKFLCSTVMAYSAYCDIRLLFQVQEMEYDPIYDDPAIRPLIDAAALKAEKLLEHDPRRGQMGFCYVGWATIKKILLEEHGIDWKTPSEMNPGVLFD